MLPVGQMREQVTVQRQTTVQDAAGQPGQVWTEVHLCRAKVDRTAGQEVFSAQERNARVPTVFVIRFTSLVLPKDRLLCRNKVFNILAAVDPDGMRERTVLTCEELVEEVP